MTTSRESTQWGGPGNGVATDFDVDERVQDSSHLLVYQRVTATGDAYLLVEGLQYEVLGINEDAGCTVRFGVPPVVGSDVVILLSPPLTQTADIRNIGGRYNAVIHEDALDRLNQQIRRLWHSIRRTVRLPVTDGVLGELPSVSNLLSRYLYINASGQVVGATGEPSEPITHTQEIVNLSPGQRQIAVSGYTPGGGNLVVYLGNAASGIGARRLVPSVHYAETNSTRITLATAAVAGDYVILAIGDVFDTSMVAVAALDEPTITGVTGTTLTLTTHTYTPGVDNVWLFKNGARLSAEHYTLTNGTTITLAHAAVASDEFDIAIGRGISQPYFVATKYGQIRDPGFSVTSFAAGQMPATNLTMTNMPTANGVSVAANRITISTPGVYLVNHWGCYLNSSGATRLLTTQVRKNGVTGSLGQQNYQNVPNGEYVSLSSSVMAQLAFGDRIEVWHGIAAGAQDINVLDEKLSVMRIG